MQPAAAIGFQLRAGGGEQADSALRVVLLCGDGGEGLEVVGGAGFVPGFGREGQPFLQVSGKYTTGVRPVSKFSMGAILGNHGNAAVVVIGNDVIRLNSLLAATGNEDLPGGF